MRFPWQKVSKTPENIILESQSEISGRLVAQMLTSFKTEFNGMYSTRTMVEAFTAVGPMQTFLGHCIKEGLISVGKKVD